MDDLVRKALLFGVGVTVITKEKAEKVVKELQKKQKISPQEGKKMVREIMKQSEKKTNDLANFVAKRVDLSLASVRKSDLSSSVNSPDESLADCQRHKMSDGCLECCSME